jgi:NTE family protein
MERLLVRPTFDACRVPVAVSVFDIWSRETRVATRGAVAPAVCASCAVPVLFHPALLDGRPSFDGGILDRPGLAGMPVSERRVLFHHIPSKSPWRRVLTLPTRPGMVTLVLEGMPRSGPFRLHEGRRAYRAARAAMKRALDTPIEGGMVVVPG